MLSEESKLSPRADQVGPKGPGTPKERLRLREPVGDPLGRDEKPYVLVARFPEKPRQGSKSEIPVLGTQPASKLVHGQIVIPEEIGSNVPAAQIRAHRSGHPRNCTSE